MADKTAVRIVSLTTTVAVEADAHRLVQALLDARLAACAQVEAGLHSFYRWNGKNCRDSECRLTIKSLPAVLPALLAFVRQHHPYELPQLLWHEQDASPEYAAWVAAEVSLP